MALREKVDRRNITKNLNELLDQLATSISILNEYLANLEYSRSDTGRLYTDIKKNMLQRLTLAERSCRDVQREIEHVRLEINKL